MLSFRRAGIYIYFTKKLSKHFKFWYYWSVFQCHLTVYPLSGLASAWDEHNALPALFVLLTRFTCCNVERGDLDCSSLQTNSPKLMNVNAAHEQNKSGKRRMALKTEVNRWNLCSVHPNTRLSALVSKCSKSALELKLPNTCLYYMKEDSESTWWGGSQSSDWCWLPKHRLHMPSIKMVMESSATTQSVSTAHTVIQTPTLYHFSCMPWSMRAYTRHFQIHRHFWPLNGFVNCLIQLEIVNHEDFRFNTQFGVEMQKS